MGNSDNQVQETEAQRALASVAKARLADYQNRWAPVENFFMQKISSPEPIREREIGRAAAETRGQFGAARERVVDSLAAAGGAAPGSGKFSNAMSSLGISEARSGGINRTAADQAVEDQYVKGLQEITQIGRGQSSDAFKGYGATANMSGQAAAADARIAEMESEGLGRTVGTALGAYGGYRGLGTPPAVTGLPTTDGVGLNPARSSVGSGLRL